MLRTTLQQVHDSYDAERWADYEALYAGGKKFFARLDRFLVQNPQEPAQVYAVRKKEAHYRCYLGGIVDYFASFLFGSSLVMKATEGSGKKERTVDQFYAEFREDCDGKDNDIHVFLRGRAIEAMTKRVSWWLVEMPPAAEDDPEVKSKADWNAKGLGRARLRDLSADQVLDWEIDDDGFLLWAIVLSVKVVRPRPSARRTTVIERYEIYDRSHVAVYELVYTKSKPPARNADVPMVTRRKHGFSTVPLVNIDVGDALWIANRVASPQTEHFRLSCAQGWGLRRTCYAMPVFNVENQDRPPTMGTGYYLMIGLKEKMEWASPPATPYEAIREEVKGQKDEIYRVVHQMAMGVDNNAAAVGRSAESKTIDSAAVRVILDALGKIVREAVERTYALVSEGRGDDDYDWSISGLDDFSDVDITDLVNAALGINTLSIPSPTFQREWMKRLADAALPDADQAVKDKVAEEIETNVTAESVLRPQVPGDPDDDEKRDGHGSGDDRGPPARDSAPPPA